MLASDGVSYAGDFLVADLREDRHLEVILVDVCGKGTGAGPAALQFAGALGGLIGAMPPEELFRAANDFLLRQNDDESFATAVHLLVDLGDGGYQITSAGHPPALRLDLPSGEWLIDNARGTALGVLADPELHVSHGRLFAGEALLFYTDGVVEDRSAHIDVGIAWLQRAAREAIGSGFGGAATRIIGQVESGDDDRAVLILSRTAVPAPEPRLPSASRARGSRPRCPAPARTGPRRRTPPRRRPRSARPRRRPGTSATGAGPRPGGPWPRRPRSAAARRPGRPPGCAWTRPAGAARRASPS